jgi:hypothetical protein
MTYGKTPLTIAAAGGILLAAAASGATAVGAPHARAALIPTPKLHITATTTGHGDTAKSTMTVKGPRHFSAGRVNVVLRAKRGEQEFDIVRLHKGYTYADVGRDFNTFFSAQQPTPKALKALNRIAHRVTFYGGLDSGNGHKVVTGSVVLPRAGTYLLINDASGPGAEPPVKLHVSKRRGTRATPSTSATVRAITAKRFRGATRLPASGTITFHNASTNSPHFLFLQHVKKGTTRRQVIKGLSSNSGPDFGLKGGVGVDAVSPGQTMTLGYSLPKGTYAEMCFFPDLQTGMPHALMGMVRIVHLK